MDGLSESDQELEWDPTNVLGSPQSSGSCIVMDPFITIGALKKGTSDEDVAFFLESDDSEKERRRHRHRTMPDPLKKLLKEEIEELMKFLQWDMPRSAHIVSFIRMMLKWKESMELKRSGIKYKILVSREECRHDYPLTIAAYIWRGEVRGSIYAPSYFGVQELKKAIKYSKFWPSEGEKGSCEWAVYPAEAAEEFLSIKHGTDSCNYTSYPVHLYWISPKDLRAQDFEVPREFKTKRLEIDHVSTVNQYWGRHHASSSELIQQMIINNPTVGAFTFNDEFSSWALQTHYGALDIVYTVQKHRKKGVARSLLLSLAKTLDSDGIPAHAFVHRDDYVTKAFLTKCLLTFVAEYFYFYIDPPLQFSQNSKD